MGVGAGAVSLLFAHPSMPLTLPVLTGGGNVTIDPVGVYIGSWPARTGAFDIETGGQGQEAMTLEGMRSPPEPVAYPWY